MNDDLRAKFEEWAVESGKAYRDSQRGVRFYVIGDGNPSWVGFQAAASLYAKDAERLREALTYVSAHYSASLDHKPPYLKAVRAALEGEPK